MPSRKGQRLKTKVRWFSTKVLSRASFPRKFSVITSLEEKRGAKTPLRVVRVQEERSHKIPKSKDARYISKNSIWACSSWRKAYTDLTGIRKIRFGPLLRQQWFFRFNHSAHQQEVACWEQGILHKVKQDYGSSQNDKAKEILGFQPPTQKAAELNPFYNILIDLFFSQHSFLKRNKEWKHITEKCRPNWKRSILPMERKPNRTP